MDKSKAIDKIRKCLRLSRSSNAKEAAAALRQAQALMRASGVDDADLLAAEASEARARSRAARNPVDWEVQLVNMVAGCFGCDVIFVGERRLYPRFFSRSRQGEYAFIGTGPRPEIAAYVFSVLLRQAEKARAQYIAKELKRCRPASKTRRADEFCRFWIIAVEKKVQALVPSTADLQAVAAFKAKHYPDTNDSKGRERRAGRFDDRLHGFAAGETAQLHHGVDGSAQALLAVKEISG